ncbi:PH domain-containing protein [Streptomyces sp. NPDC002561]|uniref:PH domain-containing protein n=1 Tax=unclassified Streptomyces TaxID=2593676 RepID=UPI0021CCE166|nr:PH domain-containing protein [Streptomyces sp. sk2.1]
MDDQGGDSVSVWRVGGTARVAGYAIPAVVGVKALFGWAGWVSSPEAETARTAGLWTGLAVSVALFFWWAILRVRLEVGPDGIVAVNPWGTHRLALDEVASVRLGAWGAEFHHGDGFKTTAYALSELAAGTSQDRRFAELQAVLEANPDSSPR